MGGMVVRSGVAFIATLFASITPAMAAGRANPDYARWAAVKDGAWVRVRILGDLRTAEWTSRLTKLTPDEAVLDVTERKPGEGPGKTWQEHVPATLKDARDDPGPAAESGDEAVPVADQTIPCRWETRRSQKAGGAGKGGEAGETVWAHTEVPGFVKKVSWLPADPELNLPKSVTTEALVAYDLPPRGDGKAAPATRPADGVGLAARRAAPPVKFSWTYKFDPPGWRRWSKVNDGEWEERWETGQVGKFKVVGWIDDGDRRGTIVRRADGGLESVVPDAGKGALFWYHHLPGGKWSSLGNVEESTPEGQEGERKEGE